MSAWGKTEEKYYIWNEVQKIQRFLGQWYRAKVVMQKTNTQEENKSTIDGKESQNVFFKEYNNEIISCLVIQLFFKLPSIHWNLVI